MEKRLVARPGEMIFFTGAPPLPATTTSICNDFPLRPGYLAQVVIPRDMTQAEAARLAEFIKSMALPDSAGAEPK
jgi:hypothetical protein